MSAWLFGAPIPGCIPRSIVAVSDVPLYSHSGKRREKKGKGVSRQWAQGLYSDLLSRSEAERLQITVHCGFAECIQLPPLWNRRGKYHPCCGTVAWSHRVAIGCRTLQSAPDKELHSCTTCNRMQPLPRLPVARLHDISHAI
jgi:hypothetical protein